MIRSYQLIAKITRALFLTDFTSYPTDMNISLAISFMIPARFSDAVEACHCYFFWLLSYFVYDPRMSAVDLCDCFLLSNLNVFLILMQPVVDAFDPRLLISPSTHHTLDFTSMKVRYIEMILKLNAFFVEVVFVCTKCGIIVFHFQEEDLYEIDIPLSFVSSVGTRVHGLACWFDVLFNGRSVYFGLLVLFFWCPFIHFPGIKNLVCLM